jgi:hypothetical protein
VVNAKINEENDDASTQHCQLQVYSAFDIGLMFDEQVISWMLNAMCAPSNDEQQSQPLPCGDITKQSQNQHASIGMS